MFGHPLTRIALVSLIALAPAPGLVDAAFAEGSSSKSRAAARHNTSTDGVVEIAKSRSKSRRASRGGQTAEPVEITQNRGKRSRRNPAGTVEPQTQMAEAPTGLLPLIEDQAATFSDHVEIADFKGDTGALALYQLAGKAAAGTTLTPAEQAALGLALAGTDLATLISDTEARLIEAKAEDETLDAIAAALGVTRPVFDPAQSPNLGASLQIETPATSG